MEDVRQQLLLYLVGHVGDYDGRRGTPERHAAMLITTAVALLLRDRRLQKHGGGRPPASLDVVTNGQRPADEYLSPADYGRRLGREPRAERDAMEMRLDLADAVGSLPAALQALASLLLQGQTVASAARLAGRSRGQVHRDVEAIRAHLKRYGLHER